MKVCIVQSNFLPWRGYFDLIRESDLFVVYDDVQFTKNDWRNRNRIKTPRGTRWITVPVHRHLHQLIEQTPIDYSSAWAEKMLNRIRESYRAAPHFQPYFSELAALLQRPAGSISELNVRLLRWACGHLSIATPMVMSRAYRAAGAKTERLIGILREAKASAYLSGPAAQAYLRPEMFAAAGIALHYKEYRYPEYEQLHPPYDPAVSVIDLLFMTGDRAARFLEKPRVA
jgi:WbqC-like protein family